jgi:hypothetical protein
MIINIDVLTNRDIEHREDFRNYILNNAEPWHREYLGRLYQLWDEWNAVYFDSKMISPYILLSEPSNPKRYGDCGPVSGFGGKSQIRIRPSLLTGKHPDVIDGQNYTDGRFLFVADILLHEMVHQFNQEVIRADESSYHGHGPIFRDKCNEIGGKLGLLQVRTCKARGREKDFPSCSQWPHNVRLDGY